MFCRLSQVCALLGLLLAGAPLARAAEPAAPAKDAAYWVERLGAATHKERLEAREQLLALGLAARAAVTAATKSDDPEIALAAREVLDQLRAQGLPGDPAEAAAMMEKLRTNTVTKDDWQTMVERQGAGLMVLLIDLAGDASTKPATQQGWVQLLQEANAPDLLAQVRKLDAPSRAATLEALKPLAVKPTTPGSGYRTARLFNALGEHGLALQVATITGQRWLSVPAMVEAAEAIRAGKLGANLWEGAGEQLFQEQSVQKRVYLLAYYARLAQLLGQQEKLAPLVQIARLEGVAPGMIDRLADQLIQQGLPKLALAVLANPNSAVQRYLVLKTKAGKVPEITPEQLADLAPMGLDEPMLYLLAQRLDQDQSPAADELFKRCLSTPPENSAIDFNALLRLSENTADRGDLLAAADHLEAALALLTKAENVTVPEADQERLRKLAAKYRAQDANNADGYETKVRLAKQAIRAEKYDAAIAMLEDATLLRPNEPDAYLLIYHAGKQGNKYSKLEKVGKIIAKVPQADERDPLGLAYILADVGAGDRALELIAPLVEDEQRGAGALLVQAYALERLQRYDDALASLVKARDLGLETVNLHRNFGTLLGGMGRLAEAADHFDEALHLDPQDDYCRIWLSLMHRRLGQNDQEALKNYLGMRGFKDSDWPRQMLRYLLGELKDEELVAAAAVGVDAELARGQACEAWFVVGQRRLADKDTAGAMAAFTTATAFNISVYIEHVWSQHELKRLAK
jgi:hypothetical protein